MSVTLAQAQAWQTGAHVTRPAATALMGLSWQLLRVALAVYLAWEPHPINHHHPDNRMKHKKFCPWVPLCIQRGGWAGLGCA